MVAIAKFETGVVETLSKTLGDTGSGFTGSEIARLLQESRIEDIQPGITKWKRLYEAFVNKQNQDKCANNILAFIQNAMQPVRHCEKEEWFESTRSDLNRILAFTGYSLGQDGKITATTKAKTISEAAAKANQLREKLLLRQPHPDVLKYCKEELLVDNYFHSVFEATKSVADKIRLKTGLNSDGASLVDDAFTFRKKIPLLALNTLQTESEQSEQKGFMNLLKGLFGTFRNTTAHAPKIKWCISEIDALDILSMVSLVHRRLDEAVETKGTAQ